MTRKIKKSTRHTVFKQPLIPIQEKGRRVPIHNQKKVGDENKSLIRKGHIVKLNKYTSEFFVAPVVITAKKDGSVKKAIDAKPMNAEIFRNQYQMPNLLEPLIVAAQTINSSSSDEDLFTSLDLKYAFSQLKLSDPFSNHCNFNIVCGYATGTYRFKTGFYGLSDVAKKFQKAMNNTLNNFPGVICFLDDILIVMKGSISDHNLIVNNVFERLYKKGFALKLSKCEFSVKKISWLGFDIDHLGYRPKHSKVQAILELKPPRTLKQLSSYIGVLNHLQRFLPNLQLYTEKFRPSLTSSNK